MKVALVCSHGGHLTELLKLSGAWEGCDVFWITYRSTRTLEMSGAYLLQNIGLNPLLMIVGAVRIAAILARERPDVVVSTGAELAIPAFYIARAMRIRSVFIEVWTRVRRPTGTGLLVYPVANEFFVQWPQLLKHYGRRARYAGALL